MDWGDRWEKGGAGWSLHPGGFFHCHFTGLDLPNPRLRRKRVAPDELGIVTWGFLIAHRKAVRGGVGQAAPAQRGSSLLASRLPNPGFD